jgi:dGTPase
MGTMIAFSDRMYQEAKILKQFLRENLYRHYLVNRMTSKARTVVRELFAVFMAEPILLPPDYQIKDVNKNSDMPALQARKIADYIAGMTDRFAIKEHKRLFLIEEV